MKKYILITILITLFVLTNCVKHEVVPAPEPLVDLEAHFTGVVNGTDIEYTEDVDGYNGSSSYAQYTTTTAIDTHVYYASMTSDLKTASIRIGLGGISWEYSTATSPTLLQFNSFFDTLMVHTEDPTPFLNFSLAAKEGFDVQYVDNDGRTWNSSLLHDGNLLTNPSLISVDPKFTSMSKESDNTGDYLKFSITFSCELYRFVEYYTIPPSTTQLPNYDTIRLTDAVYTGWIKR